VLTAAIIFAATYLVVALGRAPGIRLDRTGAAVVGAAFMVAFHVVTPERAYAMVDLGTLVLLFGTMVLVGHLRLAGFFRWVAASVARRAASPRQLLAGLVGVAGLLSAVFVNDTICLALATASNIGSTATLTGNPQNMHTAGAALLLTRRVKPEKVFLIVVEGARKACPIGSGEYLGWACRSRS
jgi:Na+/H+ antiporter NhaD/arsenite permease-like protein